MMFNDRTLLTTSAGALATRVSLLTIAKATSSGLGRPSCHLAAKHVGETVETAQPMIRASITCLLTKSSAVACGMMLSSKSTPSPRNCKVKSVGNLEGKSAKTAAAPSSIESLEHLRQVHLRGGRVSPPAGDLQLGD